MSPRETWLGRLEALLLLGLGAACMLLAASDRYGVLMNPSFRWVTASGGGLVAAMALALLRRPRRGRLSGILTLGTLFALALWTNPLKRGASVMAPGVPPAATLEREGYERLDPQSIFEGFQQENPGLGGRQAIMGGLVKRTPAMDAAGRYALLDPVMACCLADAIALGVIVDLEGSAPPADAEWVYVYGELREASEEIQTPPLRTGTIIFTAVSKTYLLHTHDLVTYRALLEDVVEKIPPDRCARFRAALEQSGLADELRGTGPFTVFVPLDLSLPDAFEGTPDLRMYLKSFVVRGRHEERAFFDVESLETLSGRRLRVEASNGRLRIEGARILFSDPMARNGTIHLIHPAWTATDD